MEITFYQTKWLSNLNSMQKQYGCVLIENVTW